MSVERFLGEMADASVLRLGESLENAYTVLIEELRGTFAELDNLTYDLDVDSAENAAAQAHRLFPTHCLKCLAALTDIEARSVSDGKGSNVLGWPAVTLIDVGCGAGAASAALLALLQRYQEFLLARGGLLSPVRVSVIGVDAGAAMLDLYSRLVGMYSQSLVDWLIDVNLDQVQGRFPQVMWQLTRSHRPSNKDIVILVMSNVVRALGQSFARGSTPTWEGIRRVLGGEPPGEPGFGEAEARALTGIVEDWGVGSVGLLSIVTSGKDAATGKWWHEQLSAMTNGMSRRLVAHDVKCHRVRDRRLTFENPRSSLWRSRDGRLRHDTTYHYDWLVVADKVRAGDDQWRRVLAPDNLELAWARARRHATHEALTDEIEVRLFDANVEENLSRLRKSMLANDWLALNMQHAMPFDVPKKEGETRPKRVARLEEQAVAAAVIQAVGSSADRFRRASYAYRLNKRRDEFLYQYWLNRWKAYLRRTHKSAQSRRVLRSDVTRFYEKIEQDTLVDIINRTTSVSGLTEELVHALLCRDCGPPHSTGMGLPQGHVASGFWADLYLSQVDAILSQIQGVVYTRYADDMVFAIDSDIVDSDHVRCRLETALRELGDLVVSEDKTFTQVGGQYVNETSLADCLTELDRKRFKPLMEQVYKLDRAPIAGYLRDEWRFVREYRELLALIPLFVSVPWLRRKIDQYRSRWRGLFGGGLKIPPFPSEPRLHNHWLLEFAGLNPEWTDAHAQLRDDLTALCQDSAETLLQSGGTRAVRHRARRRLRFAAYRLCVLGLGDAAPLLADLVLERPCLVPVQSVCCGLADCGDHRSLLRIAGLSESPYVRACAIRALADVRPSVPDRAINLMVRTMEDDLSMPCEKLKASEALLYSDRWDGVTMDDCRALVEQEADPYVVKNCVLIMGRALGASAAEYLSEYRRHCPHPVVQAAVQWTLQHPGGNLASAEEPSLVCKYYAKKYPVVETDTQEEDSP